MSDETMDAIKAEIAAAEPGDGYIWRRYQTRKETGNDNRIRYAWLKSKGEQDGWLLDSAQYRVTQQRALEKGLDWTEEEGDAQKTYVVADKVVDDIGH